MCRVLLIGGGNECIHGWMYACVCAVGWLRCAPMCSANPPKLPPPHARTHARTHAHTRLPWPPYAHRRYDRKENEVNAVRNIHLFNSSDKIFAPGSIAVLDGGLFSGQSLFTPLVPGDDTLIPYGEVCVCVCACVRARVCVCVCSFVRRVCRLAALCNNNCMTGGWRSLFARTCLCLFVYVHACVRALAACDTNTTPPPHNTATCFCRCCCCCCTMNQPTNQPTNQPRTAPRALRFLRSRRRRWWVPNPFWWRRTSPTTPTKLGCVTRMATTSWVCGSTIARAEKPRACVRACVSCRCALRCPLLLFVCLFGWLFCVGVLGVTCGVPTVAVAPLLT